MKTQQELFQDYLKQYGKFHFIYSMHRPQKWKIYPDELDSRDTDETIINHREIFPCEIVFDFDLVSPKHLKFYYSEVSKRLKKYKMSYTAYNSGGKCSVEKLPNHVHVFIPEVGRIPTENRKLYKEQILKFFLGKYEHSSHVDFQLCSRHMVRAEGGKHEKTGREKILISTYEPTIQKENMLPPVLKNIIVEKLNDLHSRKEGVTTHVKTDSVFPCVEYLMSQDFGSLGDGRQRALTILSNFYYKTLGEAGYDKVREWNDYKLNRYFNEGKLKSTFNSIKKMVDEGRRYGCTTIKRLLKEFNKEKICKTCFIVR